jgi:hypothetical protein
MFNSSNLKGIQMQMPQQIKDLIMRSHGGLIQQVIELENQRKAKALQQLRELSNKANKGE